MAKKILKASTGLYPCPVVLVSVGSPKGKANFMTVAWCGIICSEPPQLSVSIRPKRLTHAMIKEIKDFTINIPKASMVKEVDLAGVISGKDVDKFEKLHFTNLPASKIRSPLIKECPINIECRLIDVKALGTHDMFIGEVVAVQVDEELLDKEQNIDYKKAQPLVYVQGEYWSLFEKIGHYGFSNEAQTYGT
ncbi:MAG: flavin reductase family protein [Candidatus Omnitrophota bacterium]